MTDNLNQKGLEAFRAWYKSHVGKVLTRANAEKAIAAYLAEAGPAVQVKPLEWTAEPTEKAVWRGHGILGRYTVASGSWWGPEPTNEFHSGATDDEAAKAAAQADYESRIRSVLVSLPVEREGWVLVPIQRTEEMHRAAQGTTGALLTHGHSEDIWLAMIDAVPAPPQQGER